MIMSLFDFFQDAVIWLGSIWTYLSQPATFTMPWDSSLVYTMPFSWLTLVAGSGLFLILGISIFKTLFKWW